MNCGQPLSSGNRSNPRLSPVSGATRWHPEPGGSLVRQPRNFVFVSIGFVAGGPRCHDRPVTGPRRGTWKRRRCTPPPLPSTRCEVHRR
jgi:hypothetical protein